MSSTNRGAERAPNDFYETPGWVTLAIWREIAKTTAGDVLDPCAGRGAILEYVDSLRGFELDHERAEHCRDRGYIVETRDALAPEPWNTKPGPFSVVMNPPFGLAQEFVERALAEVLPTGGTVAALLRLSFLATKKRAALLKAHPPDVYVLSRRPSFTGGSTDSADYAWLTWGAERGGHWYLIDDAPPSKRKVPA